MTPDDACFKTDEMGISAVDSGWIVAGGKTLEVKSSPGLQGGGKTSGLDIESAILEHEGKWILRAFWRIRN